jgi:hypothetical protein
LDGNYNNCNAFLVNKKSANFIFMTTLIIKSNSEEKTHLLLQFAEELGLSATTQNFRELTAGDMVKGIGRKATDEELLDYLLKDKGEPVNR